jgi:hypothetical protein
MSQGSSIKINLIQNHPDFKLRLLNKQATLFKKGYLKKTLDPIQEDPKDTYIYTIKCLVRACK